MLEIVEAELPAAVEQAMPFATARQRAKAVESLHKAARTGVVHTIGTCLAPGGDASLAAELLAATDGDGNTALHWAAKNGHDHAIFYLISQGAKCGPHMDPQGPSATAHAPAMRPRPPQEIVPGGTPLGEILPPW